MKKALIIFFVIILTSISGLFANDNNGFKNFITVKGDQIFDGDQEFRFISFNIPNLLTVEDNMPFTEKNAWRLPNSFEIEDALKTIKLMGGRVARTYVITVKRKTDDPEIIKYVEGPGKFNERAFEAMDSVLAIANKVGVRLLIPFVDNWKWMGGVPQYAEFRGKPQEAFWTDPQIKADFKKTISFILNRVNTVSGIRYKDDKAILAWELGNELRNLPMEWVAEMAAYVKSIDSNHLINDGFQNSYIPKELLDIPEIDILSTHHYENNPHDMLAHIRESAALAKGKKPYYVGEFGFISTTGIREVLDLVQQNKHICGALTWSLRFHNRDGGFYWHSEPMGGGLYKAYHYPGFVSGNEYDEKNLLKLFTERAAQIQNLKIKITVVPNAPRLLPISDVSKISWQGSVGAESYKFERADSKSGQWKVVGENISDAEFAYAPLFNDVTAKRRKSYFYRIKAKNTAGTSKPSQVFGPVQVNQLTLVDEMQNFAVLYHRKGKLSIENGSARSFKEDFHRIHGEKGSEIIYYVHENIKSFQIYSFSKSEDRIFNILVSSNGKDYKSIGVNRENYFAGKADYDYWQPILLNSDFIPDNMRYLKIEYNAPAQIGRVEVVYAN